MKINVILAGKAMSLLLLALPAAASDHTLGIYGNANEDDTINMQDVTYTELNILEYRDETELSDAKRLQDQHAGCDADRADHTREGEGAYVHRRCTKPINGEPPH